MSALSFSDDPARAFEQVTLWHLVVSMLILMIPLAGELVKFSVEDFDGYVDLGNAAWIVRIGVALWVLYGVFISILLVRERRIIKGLMKLEPQRREAAVLRALTTTQLLRSMQGPGASSVGLVLFFCTAEQLDLLAPAIVGAVFAVVTVPRRAHWMAVFSDAAAKYAGVVIPAI